MRSKAPLELVRCLVLGVVVGVAVPVPELDDLPVDSALTQVAATLPQPGTVTADMVAGEMVCSLSALAVVLLAHPLLFNRSFSAAPVAALPFPTQRNCMIPAGIRTGS